MPNSEKQARQGCDLKNRRVEGFAEAPHYGSCAKGMPVFPRVPSKDASRFAGSYLLGRLCIGTGSLVRAVSIRRTNG